MNHNNATGVQTTTDGNGNFYTTQNVTLPNGNPATVISDQLNRKITIEKPVTNGSLTRAQVLRGLIDSAEVYSKFFNEGFVIMSYFGYLRRTADGAYVDWINVMNQTGGDYRIMINGFMNSIEYRQRFGP